jgi:RNA polymerase sigma factor (sigma-70 family)
MNIEQLVEQNQSLIYGIAHQLYRNNPIFSVEDLAQIGFLAICKNGDKYDKTRAKLSTFLTHCARNDMMKFIKANKNNTTYLYDNIKEVSYSQYNDVNFESPEEYLNVQNDLEKQVMYMKRDGETNVTISRTLNISEAKVAQILQSVYGRLRLNNE